MVAVTEPAAATDAYVLGPAAVVFAETSAAAAEDIPAVPVDVPEHPAAAAAALDTPAMKVAAASVLDVLSAHRTSNPDNA